MPPKINQCTSLTLIAFAVSPTSCFMISKDSKFSKSGSNQSSKSSTSLSNSASLSDNDWSPVWWSLVDTDTLRYLSFMLSNLSAIFLASLSLPVRMSSCAARLTASIAGLWFVMLSSKILVCSICSRTGSLFAGMTVPCRKMWSLFSTSSSHFSNMSRFSCTPWDWLSALWSSSSQSLTPASRAA